MSAMSATVLLRRCVGGAPSAFIGRTTPHRLSQSRIQKHTGSTRHVTPNKSDRAFISSVLPRSFVSLHPFGARHTTRMPMSTTTTPQTDYSTSSLIGIDWVRSSVVRVLNEIFDPVEIAKGAAIAKLDGKKKTKKKKQPQDEQSPQDEPSLSEDERNAIINAAAASAKPFSNTDAMITPATKPEFGDYQCNAAMSLAKSAGLNPRDCAAKIVEGLKNIPGFNEIMEEPEIAGPGFINLRFREGYLADAAGKMAMDSAEGGRLAVPMTAYVPLSKRFVYIELSCCV